MRKFGGSFHGSCGSFLEVSTGHAEVSRKFGGSFHGSCGSFAEVSMKLPRFVRKFRGNFPETSRVVVGSHAFVPEFLAPVAEFVVSVCEKQWSWQHNGSSTG